MKISDLLKLSTDNLRRRKGRTALTVIGVVVGTCAIVVMISLGIATNRRTDEMLSTWSDLTQIQVFSYSENPDTPALDDKKMCIRDRYLHSRRAVSPLLLTVMMAFALISMAVVQAAWATAPATLSCPSIVRLFRRLS